MATEFLYATATNKAWILAGLVLGKEFCYDGRQVLRRDRPLRPVANRNLPLGTT